MIVVPIEAHKMKSENERVERFVQAFESNYGRKPTLQDAEGNFRLRVAQDMNMSVGGARYYLRLAAELDRKKDPDTSD
jgi:hypothetical protein